MSFWYTFPRKNHHRPKNYSISCPNLITITEKTSLLNCWANVLPVQWGDTHWSSFSNISLCTFFHTLDETRQSTRKCSMLSSALENNTHLVDLRVIPDVLSLSLSKSGDNYFSPYQLISVYSRPLQPQFVHCWFYRKYTRSTITHWRWSACTDNAVNAPGVAFTIYLTNISSNFSSSRTFRLIFSRSLNDTLCSQNSGADSQKTSWTKDQLDAMIQN